LTTPSSEGQGVTTTLSPSRIIGDRRNAAAYWMLGLLQQVIARLLVLWISHHYLV